MGASSEVKFQLPRSTVNGDNDRISLMGSCFSFILHKNRMAGINAQSACEYDSVVKSRSTRGVLV